METNVCPECGSKEIEYDLVFYQTKCSTCYHIIPSTEILPGNSTRGKMANTYSKTRVQREKVMEEESWSL